MNYTIYNPITGQITGQLTCDNEQLMLLNIGDSHYITGYYDSDYYYIKDQQAVAKEAKPLTFDAVYEFDYTTKTYIVNTSATTDLLRQKRHALLNTLDRVNPVWYSSLSVDQQQQLQTYRQALLDVPQQTGFPLTVEWPAKPTWLPG